MLRTFLALTLVVVPLALADHQPIGRCDPHGPRVGVIEISAGTTDTTFYLEDRGVLQHSFWLYMESNGIWHAPGNDHNLQRGGVAVLTDNHDICVDLVDAPADTLLV